MVKIICKPGQLTFGCGRKPCTFEVHYKGSIYGCGTLQQAVARKKWLLEELPMIVKREVKRELKSVHTAQNSFYGKAYVVDTIEGYNTLETCLYSYNTKVVTIDFQGGLKVYIPDMHSKTTRRHIREFILQQFDCMAWDIISTGYRHGLREWEYNAIR